MCVREGEKRREMCVCEREGEKERERERERERKDSETLVTSDSTAVLGSVMVVQLTTMHK